MTDDLDDVRQQIQAELYSPGVTAQIDAFRASIHEQLIALGIDPSSENREFELTWMVSGGALAQLLASQDTCALLIGLLQDDVKRGALAAHLFWSAGISPHETEKLSG